MGSREILNSLDICIRWHSVRVEELCIRFAVALSLGDEDKNILRDAARLHDMEKSIPKKRHAAAAAIRILNLSGIAQQKKVSAIISAHNGAFAPSIDLWLLSAILRLSDKLDRFQKRKKHPKRGCRKCWKEIKKWCAHNGVKGSAEYITLKKTYKNLLQEKAD